MKEKGNAVVSIILFIIVVILVLFILVEHGVVNIPGFEFLKIENTTADQSPKEAVIETSNPNVKALIEQVHNPSQPIDEVIYKNGGAKVSEMSQEYKFAIATNNKNLSLTAMTPTPEGYTAYISEKDVKAAYEKLFGLGTYKATTSFNFGCAPMTYDNVNARYVTNVTDCGNAITPTSVSEEVIEATKSEKNLTVVTAVVFYDSASGKLYKDANLTEEIQITNGTTLTEDQLSQYTIENANSLQQYRYTFNVGTDGFYYYDSAERING